jgi:hypothetical protein
MNEVAQGKKPASVFSDYLKKQNETYGPDDIKMFFTSNHDENSWKGTEFERMGPAHQSLFVLASTFQNGMPLIYNGQEASLNKRLRFFDKDTITWENQDLVPFYSSMLKLKHENPALWNGVHGGKQVEIPTAYPREIYAYYREKNGNRVVTLLNFSDKKLLVENLPKELYGSYNSLKGSSVTLNDKASITLEPYGYGVLTQQQK